MAQVPMQALNTHLPSSSAQVHAALSVTSTLTCACFATDMNSFCMFPICLQDLQLTRTLALTRFLFLSFLPIVFPRLTQV